MLVNIIVKRGWILERMAEELARAIPDVTINLGRTERAVDTRAPLNYYMPAKDVLKFEPPARCHAIGLFTHGPVLPEILARLSACTSMNRRVAGELRRLGMDDVTVIRPGTEPPRRAPVFGVVGRPYNSGRKGERLVERAVEAGFRLVACTPREKVRATSGAKWPCPVTHTTDRREAFYASIDYLVVPALEEGGPIPVLEALARHVPVIAPDVGWCWEFPVIKYERGSWDSLREVLEGLAKPPTWSDWAEQHRSLFRRLLKAKAA
jgi:hypothetical protein